MPLSLTSRLISHKMLALAGRTGGKDGRLFFPSKFVATAVVIRLPSFLILPLQSSERANERARVGKKN